MFQKAWVAPNARHHRAAPRGWKNIINLECAAPVHAIVRLRPIETQAAPARDGSTARALIRVPSRDRQPMARAVGCGGVGAAGLFSTGFTGLLLASEPTERPASPGRAGQVEE